MMTNKDFKLHILGNGPSLKYYDFKSEKNTYTMGMNLAFRHWKKLKWFPDFYSCCDILMNEQFSHEIKKLTGLYRKTKFLLRIKSGIDQKGNVTHLESLLHENQELLPWITTGSISLVWAVLMGFKYIELYGIDMLVTEQIEESEQIDAETFFVKSTPLINPNYFFSDYQREGDKYLKPNITPQYHLKSWIMAKEFALSKNVNIINMNPKSRLGIFKFPST